VTVLGLYDEFDAEIICPNCKRKVTMGFQTKALLNLLLHFRAGDKAETPNLIVKDGTITDALGPCPKCKTLLTAEIAIKDGILQSIQNIKQKI